MKHVILKMMITTLFMLVVCDRVHASSYSNEFSIEEKHRPVSSANDPFNYRIPSNLKNSTDNDSNSTLTSAPTPSPKSNVTNAPTLSPSPTTVNHTSTASPTMTPTSNGTIKPTKKYTHEPTSSPTSSMAPTTIKHHHRKSIWKTFLTFVSWIFVTLISVLICGKCMSNRTQIYFGIMELWYNLSHRIDRLDLGERFTNAWGFIKSAVHGLYRRITRRNVGPAGVMDEDGSTMMQGLLLRENV